ncbi:MAG: diguanylate cyclase [Desulfotomaculales bacterium]
MERERNRRIRESMSLILAALFLTQFVAVIICGNIDPVEVCTSPQAFTGAVSAFLLMAAVLYLADTKELVVRQSGKTFSGLWGLLYIAISFLFALVTVAVTGGGEGPFKFLFGAPVLVAAVLHGRLLALATGLFAVAAVVILNLLPLPSGLLVPDVLLAFFMLFLGYAVGGITDVEAAYATRLKDLTDHDGLTGLYNHRAFHEKLHAYFENAAAGKEPLTLLMADIDHFKLYNDYYGHRRGDEVLARVGEVLSRTVGDAGVAARYGGEEFAVILPGRTAEDGRRLAEKLQDAVGGISFCDSHTQPLGKLTLSFGVATYPVHAHDPGELINHTDDALYRAKLSAKGKVEVYSCILDPLYRSLSREERDTPNSIRTLLRMVNAKDNYTFWHSERVANYAVPRLIAVPGKYCAQGFSRKVRENNVKVHN